MKKLGINKRFRLSLEGKRAIAGYMFVLPFILGLIALFIPSIIDSIHFSMSDIKYTDTGYITEPVGFELYIKTFTHDIWYVNELKNSVINMVRDVPLIVFFSFFIALLLNQNFKGRTVARAIYFLPVIISAGVMLSVENANSLTALMETGDTVDVINAMDITKFLLNLGLPPQLVTTVADIMGKIYGVISTSGVQILIFLAALQTIPASLYEASTMEGATGWENFWKITFPMLSPYILTNVVYSVIDVMSSTRSPFMKIVNSVSQTNLEFGLAMSMVFFAIISAVLIVFVLLVSRLVFYYD